MLKKFVFIICCLVTLVAFFTPIAIEAQTSSEKPCVDKDGHADKDCEYFYEGKEFSEPQNPDDGPQFHCGGTSANKVVDAKTGKTITNAYITITDKNNLEKQKYPVGSDGIYEYWAYMWSEDIAARAATKFTIYAEGYAPQPWSLEAYNACNTQDFHSKVDVVRLTPSDIIGCVKDVSGSEPSVTCKKVSSSSDPNVVETFESDAACKGTNSLPECAVYYLSDMNDDGNLLCLPASSTSGENASKRKSEAYFTYKSCANAQANKPTAGPTHAPISTPTPTKTPTPPLPPCAEPTFADRAPGETEGGKFVGCGGVAFGIDRIMSTSPEKFISSLFGLLLSISGGILLAVLIYSGYQFMTSQGNAEKIQAARERITSAIIGFMFLIFSLVVLEVIGVDILHLPGWLRDDDTSTSFRPAPTGVLKDCGKKGNAPCVDSNGKKYCLDRLYYNTMDNTCANPPRPGPRGAFPTAVPLVDHPNCGTHNGPRCQKTLLKNKGCKDGLHAEGQICVFNKLDDLSCGQLGAIPCQTNLKKTTDGCAPEYAYSSVTKKCQFRDPANCGQWGQPSCKNDRRTGNGCKTDLAPFVDGICRFKDPENCGTAGNATCKNDKKTTENGCLNGLTVGADGKCQINGGRR